MNKRWSGVLVFTYWEDEQHPSAHPFDFLLHERMTEMAEYLMQMHRCPYAYSGKDRLFVYLPEGTQNPYDGQTVTYRGTLFKVSYLPPAPDGSGPLQVFRDLRWEVQEQALSEALLSVMGTSSDSAIWKALATDREVRLRALEHYGVVYHLNYPAWARHGTEMSWKTKVEAYYNTTLHIEEWSTKEVLQTASLKEPILLMSYLETVK